ncbi:MAG TPA: GNAT family N-acetyltransferase [Coleofasciculaceae cyanobacterium]
MKILQTGYKIRSARFEELTLLSAIELAAARLFLDTPYAFLVHAAPLPLDFLKQQFEAGQVWVAADLQDRVVGYAVTQEVDATLYLQQIDVVPAHMRQGIGSALVNTVVAWAKRQGYSVMALSTFRDIPWNAPFYSKLGFCPVDESELTAGFQQIRLQEAEMGLPILERVIMQRELRG